MPVSRRDLLLRFGPAALLVWPIVRSAQPTRAGGSSAPRRFITFFSSSGVHQEFFWPSGSPGAAASGSYDVTGTSLEGLAPYLDDIIIPRGIRINRGGSDSHNEGSCSILTGRDQRSESSPYADGQSLDHFLGKQLSTGQPFETLLMGTRLQCTRPSMYISFDENGVENEFLQNPFDIYNSLFAPLVGDCQGGGPSPELLAARDRRKSVLDVVSERTSVMQARCGMGQAEAQKLERMADSIRSIEQVLDSIGEPVTSANCEDVRDVMTGEPVENSDTNYPTLLKLHLDLMVLALELDFTRVATVSLSLGGSCGAPMTWLQWVDANGNAQAIDSSHHSTTHGLQRNVENHIEKLRVIDRWNFDQFAYLVGKLKEIEEEDGTLLDNSIAWYATDVSDGGPHSTSDMPFIVAGRGGGDLATGYYAQLEGTPNHQQLLLSFIHKLGLTDVTSWGKPGASDAGTIL
ncbi:MAG: DUF1552 domain-containing protein [Nannocystaceae bacterium]|nr:DUF1552 domain-containing protein [Nannocystaceae bacterium]